MHQIFMNQIASGSSSRTNLFSLKNDDSLLDSKPSTSLIIKKRILIKNSENSKNPSQLQKRKTLKLKEGSYKGIELKKDKDIHEASTKKISMNQKRKIINMVEDFHNVKYTPKDEQIYEKNKVPQQQTIRLYDKTKSAIYNFRCFKDEDLGYKKEVSNLTIETKLDNDVETDDETLKYYVKRCQNDLIQAILEEKKNKEQQKQKKK